MLHSFARLSTFLSLAVFCPMAGAQPALPFLTVELPQGVSAELPRNWRVISENQRITLDAWAASQSQRIYGEPSKSVLGFAANYYDDRGKTAGVFNIRYYPQQTVTQAEATAATPEDVREIDSELQANIIPGVGSAGNRLLEWRGTRKRSINGLTYLVTEYRRTSSEIAPFRVRLLRLLDGPRSFTITVSYREDQQYFLGTIADHIIQSVRRQF